ncbi:MAG TPA: hypothetical protein VGR60_01095 [Gemmatimonadales bacterium]|nr:hypothetical protein [Gemmatimonadales bacterium]
MRARHELTLMALLLAAAFPLSAQRPGTDGPGPRHEFWVATGLGAGREAEQCNGCAASGRQTGTVVHLAAGTTLTPDLRIGLDLTAWSRTLQGVGDQYAGTLTAVAIYYPRGASGLRLKLGAGLSGMSVEPASFVPASGFGLGGLAGVAYELPLGRRVTIAPEVTWFAGRPGDIKQGRTTALTGTRFDVIAVGMEVTFH